MRIVIMIFAALLIAACASYSGTGLKPGEARLEDVLSVMGNPEMRWKDSDGSQQLAYPAVSTRSWCESEQMASCKESRM